MSSGQGPPYAGGGHGWQWPDENPRPAPYGPQSAYGAYGPYGGYGPDHAPPQHETDGVYTHSIVALVISCLMAASCYVSLGGIPAAIMSGIALGKARTEPDTARRLLTWSWVSIGLNIALLVIGFGAFIYLGVNGHLD